MDSVASRLKERMDRKGFNQPGLARAASEAGTKTVSQQVVQHLLSGRNKTSGHLIAIARALDTSVEWLETGRHPRPRRAPESLLVGKVGAGAEIVRFEDNSALAGKIGRAHV